MLLAEYTDTIWASCRIESESTNWSLGATQTRQPRVQVPWHLWVKSLVNGKVTVSFYGQSYSKTQHLSPSSTHKSANL